MGVFESIKNASDKSVDSGLHYLESTKKYYELKLFQQVAKSFSFASKMVIAGSMLLIGLIFLSIAIVIWLGQLLGSIITACLIIAGAFFLILILVYLMRSHIDTAIIKKLSKEFFN